MSLPVGEPVLRSAKPTDRRSGLLWLAVVSWALGVLALLLLVGKGRLPGLGPHAMGIGFERAALGLGVWLALVAVWWARQRGRFDPFEPPVWISLNAYVQIVLNVWWLQRDCSSFIPWVRVNQEWLMPLAVLLIGVGLATFWAGYAWTFHRLRPHTQRLQPPAGPMQVPNVIIIWFVSWIVTTYFALTGTVSYLGAGRAGLWLNYIFFANMVGSAATFALTVYHFRHPTSLGWFWLVFCYGSNLAMALVVGTKGFAYTLLWLVACIYYATGKLPKKWLAAGFVIVVLLVPVVNGFRAGLHAVEQGEGVALTERSSILATVLAETLTRPFGTLFQETRGTFEQRQGNMLDVTASVLFLHPSQKPFLGREMIEFFFPQLIPRVLWPGKPATRSSLFEITFTYTGLRIQGLTAIGLFADSYRAGGWLAVAICFFAQGAFMAWLYLQGPGSGSLAGTIFYITCLAIFLTYESEVSIWLIRLIQFGPLLWLIVVKGMFAHRQRPYAGSNLLRLID